MVAAGRGEHLGQFTADGSRQGAAASDQVEGKPAESGKDRLQQISKGELYDRATAQKVPGRSKMNREQLIDALAKAS
ncbi:hypothetical protein ACFYWP_35740 [Actinacidiphila glaucinigra]|uniref:hypothetical protein n=1 Tax=Actinacidiphila glaucinigra TaxID=235986 RepID=UPI0036A423DC